MEAFRTADRVREIDQQQQTAESLITRTSAVATSLMRRKRHRPALFKNPTSKYPVGVEERLGRCFNTYLVWCRIFSLVQTTIWSVKAVLVHHFCTKGPKFGLTKRVSLVLDQTEPWFGSCAVSRLFLGWFGWGSLLLHKKKQKNQVTNVKKKKEK